MALVQFKAIEMAFVVRSFDERMSDNLIMHFTYKMSQMQTQIRFQNSQRPTRNATCKTRNAQNKCDSAIGHHLLENPECAKMYNDDKFRIIGQARSSFHLGVLESVYIKTQNPVLCRQKEFVFSLGLFNQEKGDSALIGHKSN